MKVVYKRVLYIFCEMYKSFQTDIDCFESFFLQFLQDSLSLFYELFSMRSSLSLSFIFTHNVCLLSTYLLWYENFCKDRLECGHKHEQLHQRNLREMKDVFKELKVLGRKRKSCTAQINKDILETIFASTSTILVTFLRVVT